MLFPFKMSIQISLTSCTHLTQSAAPVLGCFL
uniref:Uncharacterized protein n=1 Tax=Arundo donax TaxID=35708 RepID=A0A0A9HQC6_ARUDO